MSYEISGRHGTHPFGRRATTGVVVMLGLVLACTGTGPDTQGGPMAPENGPTLIHVDGSVGVNFDCPEGGENDAGSVDGPKPNTEVACAAKNLDVSFSRDVLPLIGSCTGETCHAAWSYHSVVDATSLECCDKRKLVEPGNPANSYLLQKVLGIDLCGNSTQMGNVPLQTASKISDWICLGALDN